MAEFDHGRYQRAFILNHSRLVRKFAAYELVEACFTKELITPDERTQLEVQTTETDRLNKLFFIFHRRYNIRPDIFREIFDILKEINNDTGGAFTHVIQSLQETLENPPEFPTLHDHSRGNCPSLQSYESIIIKTLDVKQILPELISRCVITIGDSEAIDNEIDFADRAKKILGFLTKRGQDSFQQFIQILRETGVYKELAEKIVSGQQNGQNVSLSKEDNDIQEDIPTLNQTHYSEVMEDIQEIAPDYKRLAAALKLPDSTIRSIECHRRNSPPWDALYDVITEWLKWNCDCKTSEGYPNRRWLVNAVKSINNELGTRLEQKYNI